jgi:hypothetical protein
MNDPDEERMNELRQEKREHDRQEDMISFMEENDGRTPRQVERDEYRNWAGVEPTDSPY